MKKILNFRFEIIITALVEVYLMVITMLMFIVAQSTMQLLCVILMGLLMFVIPFITFIVFEKIRREIKKNIK